MRMSPARLFTVVCLLAASVLLLGGCSSRKVTLQSLRRNPTPERVGMANTHDERKNLIARIRNMQKRQIRDDWDSIWLNDLTPQASFYVVP